MEMNATNLHDLILQIDWKDEKQWAEIYTTYCFWVSIQWLL